MLIKELMDEMYNKLNSTNFWKKFQYRVLSIIETKHSNYKQQDIIFIHDKITNCIKRNKKYLDVFHFQYAHANYELAKFHGKEESQNNSSRKFLEKCLVARLKYCHINLFTQTDIDIVIIYAQFLIQKEANKFSIKFINCFLKNLPPQIP